MSNLREFAKQWVTDNICDGEDRSKTGRADKHNLNSPDIYEMVDDLCKSYQDINGWISVDDRLPEDNQTVLLHTKDYGLLMATFIAYDNGNCYFGCHGHQNDLQKTHWMPLPELPKQ